MSPKEFIKPWRRMEWEYVTTEYKNGITPRRRRRRDVTD